MKHSNICSSSYEEVLEDTEAGLIVTDWEEFNAIDRGDLQTMNKALLWEGRRIDYEIDEENIEEVTWS